MEGPRRCRPAAARAAGRSRPAIRRGRAGPRGCGEGRGRAPDATGTWPPCTPARDGDAEITAEARAAVERGDQVTVVTADRLLQSAATASGPRRMSPSWLLDQLAAIASTAVTRGLRIKGSGRSCPTASRATSTSSTAGSPWSRRPAPRRSPAAGSCPAWSTRTATSASTSTARRRTRPPRRRRSPTATPARCCCATAARPADTAWIQDRDDLPRLIRAGRHIARTRRYIRNYAHEVEPDELHDVRRAGGAAAATAGSSWWGTGSSARQATWRRRSRRRRSPRRSRRRTRSAPR